MKQAATILVLAVVAFANAGCKSTLNKEQMAEIEQRITKVHVELSNKNDGQNAAYNGLVDANRDLMNKVATLERRVLVLQADVDRLKAIPAAAPAAASNPSGIDPQPPLPTARKPEDVLLELEEALVKLRADKANPDEIAAQFKTYARFAAPALVDELRKPTTKTIYTTRVEQILAQFPAADLEVPLQKGLEEGGPRFSMARVVGKVGDRKLSKILEPHAGTVDEDFRLAAGEALVLCRNAAGVPGLVKCLRSDQRDTKMIAISVLKRLNRDEDFGYRPHRPAEDNAEPVKKWEEWLEKFGKVLFD
jgi:uncharacterized small protein (DUF1192 family)